VGFKRVAVGGDLASGIAVALVPLLYHTVGLAFWQLLALVFFRALFNTPGTTARFGLLPDLIALAGASKERVNGIYQATLHGASLIGTALTGVLIALIGASNMLWLDGISFLCSATIVGMAIPVIARPGPQSKRASYGRDMAEGWRFLIGDRLLLGMTILAALVNFIGAALFVVILPVYAKRVYGTAVSLGGLFAGASVGTLVGSLLYTAIALRLSRYRIYLIGVGMLSVVFWALSPLPTLIIAMIAIALRGIATGLIAPILGVIQQERVPAELRGRVFGTSQALGTLAIPIGTLLAGYGISTVGLQHTLISMGILMLMATIWFVSDRALREMNTDAQ
jgi:predicted MFS family arabinose efflux permease